MEVIGASSVAERLIFLHAWCYGSLAVLSTSDTVAPSFQQTGNAWIKDLVTSYYPVRFLQSAYVCLLWNIKTSRVLDAHDRGRLYRELVHNTFLINGHSLHAFVFVTYHGQKRADRVGERPQRKQAALVSRRQHDIDSGKTISKFHSNFYNQ